MTLVESAPLQSTFRGTVYWFGYAFAESTSSKQRTDFINAIKSADAFRLAQPDLHKFIEAPVVNPNKMHRLSQFDFFVYPVSGRGPLVSKIIREIGNWIPRGISHISFELVKRSPSDVKFDWDSFNADYFGTTTAEQNRYNQMKSYIETELIPKIEASDYFAIAQTVPTKYRPYIADFFDVSNNSAELINKISTADGGSVLVVDDINTAGSTLFEILRILDKLNPSLNVYVYTLIGRSH